MARRGGTSAAGNVQGVTGLVLVPDACAFTWGALQIHRSPGCQPRHFSQVACRGVILASQVTVRRPVPASQIASPCFRNLNGICPKNKQTKKPRPYIEKNMTKTFKDYFLLLFRCGNLVIIENRMVHAAQTDQEPHVNRPRPRAFAALR